MIRDEFHNLFETSRPVVLPVIHVRDAAQALENIKVLTGEGARGCFLINHNFGPDELADVALEIRAAFPDLWMGINFLGLGTKKCFLKLREMEAQGCAIQGLWCDDAGIDEYEDHQDFAEEILAAKSASGWTGLYFGGVAFKYLTPVDPKNYERVARVSASFMDVVTTSGPGTGLAAEAGKIAAFRKGAGETPIALASGVTPENAVDYAGADAFIVATGINYEGDFYNIDPQRLAKLLRVAEELGRSET